MGEALPPNIQELVHRRITYMANKPINLSEIEYEWQTTNPESEALLQTIQNIVAQRITNNPNSLRLIDRVKADHREQRRKLKNQVLAKHTPYAYVKTKRSQPHPIQTQAYNNRYNVLHIEETNEDDNTEETPLIRRVEKVKTSTPIFNNDWDQIDDFIRQNEEYYRIRGITSSNTKATTTLSLIKTPDTMQWNNELKKWLEEIPNEYDIPILWDSFVQELKIKAKDVQQTNTLTKLSGLKMEGLEVKTYINEFEKLAEQAGLTATNPDTTYLFMKGLTNPIRTSICKKPIYGYRMARAYALDDVLVTRMAQYLIRSQSPTPSKELETPTPETKKRPLAADYMDEQLTKEAKIARLTTNTNFPVETFESRRQWKANQRLARALSPPQAPPKENPLLSKGTTTIRTDTSDVFISARKSMTVRTYIHTIAKRAEMIALLDSGATENFLNLTYARWLKIPIKRLPNPRTLLNVDGTENRSGRLEFYTDLQVRTGNDITRLRFFLSDLGEHKAILGYPWFAAVQPKIDWKKGWIDHTQLPIILKTSDATKATFISKTRNVPCSTHQDQFYIGRVTIFPTNDVPFEPFGKPSQPPAPKIPPEYQRHSKVFSEEASQRLPGHTIWDHAIELLPGAPTTLPGRLLPLTQVEKEEAHKLVAKHLERGTIHPSWGPYTANLFFVKKKDGKLCPLQDYRPVNKWTKKNWNVSPLIPEVID